MQNQKLQNFFKTLFFRGNRSYLSVVILFWIDVFVIVLTIINMLLINFSYGQYTSNWQDSVMGGYVWVSFIIFSLIFPGAQDFFISNGSMEKNYNFICFYNCYYYSILGEIVILSSILLFFLFLNFVGVTLYKFLIRRLIKRHGQK